MFRAKPGWKLSVMAIGFGLLLAPGRCGAQLAAHGRTEWTAAQAAAPGSGDNLPPPSGAGEALPAPSGQAEPAATAPTTSSQQGTPANAAADEATTPADSTEDTPTLAERIGRLHVLVVHFPIALIVAALFAQLMFWLTRKPSWGEFALTSLGLGALGALAAAVLGWVLAAAQGGGSNPKALELHRWMGVTAALVAGAAWLLGMWDLRKRSRAVDVAFALVLTLCAVLVGLTGHLGGVLVYGENFFFR